MLASTPINTAFNYVSNQSSWWREPLQLWIQVPRWDMQMHTSTCTHFDCWNTKKKLYERGYVFISRIAHSLPSFPPNLSPTLLLLLLTLDLSDPAKEGWKHIWPQNSPNTFYLESLRQWVKGTCCPHPKTWSNRKRMSTGVVCQLPKLREKLVFLLWREDTDCLT